MNRQETERDLIGRLAAGDSSALEPVYDQFAQPVFALLVRIVADRPVAEELLQETFVRAWQHAGRYDPARGSLLSWLMGIAHHQALNELRRVRRRRQHDAMVSNSNEPPDLDLLPGAGPGPEEAAWLTMRRSHLTDALKRLTRDERTVLELYASGYSQSDIARELREPLGTVKSRMRRGIHKLRAIAEETHLEYD
ncbi:MAG: RNA polymerase sigma factor [Thermomicrobiales bacterium]